MLNMAFDHSKYYVDSLSENTKGWLLAKIGRGDYFSLALLGYLNDYRTKTIILNKRKTPFVRQVFERWTEGAQTLEKISLFLKENGAITRGKGQNKMDFDKSILLRFFSL
jgi:hypothetical protein